MTEKRPFFSLVVPCYNDGRYAPGVYIDQLLSSVVDQGLNKDELEVIIADDLSPIPYEGTLQRYADKLTIKFIKTAYNNGPGNTRQRGADVATGQWLCFADHDDMFYPDVFKHVRTQIEKTNEQYIVYSNFNKVDEENHGRVIEKFRKGNLHTWVHGKFYNVDNFWKPFNIHFIKDLKTCEDIAIGVQVECALHKLNNKVPLHISKPVYMWICNRRSISNERYVPKRGEDMRFHPFVEYQFADVLRAEIEPLIESLDNNLISRDEATVLLISAMAKMWIYVNGSKRANSCYYKRNEAYSARAWNQIMNKLPLKLVEAKVYLQTNLKDLKVKLDSQEHADGYDFISWLEMLTTLNYNQTLDSIEADNIRASRDVSKVENGMHRPFFSIVIACYNDGRYQDNVYLDRLLSSISRQGIAKEDLEVILSDDCSPVPFDKIIAKHEHEMIIKYIKTDYNFAPGNTRAKGVTIATGEWLCFADHDDIFYDNALNKIKNAIAEKNEQHFIFGDFHGVTPEGKVIREYKCHLNWCHGKFYNKDNFWDKYGIHFIHDLKSHEDIAICTQVSCILSSNIQSYSYLGVPVYAWTDNPQSVSHAKYTVETETGPREFLEVFFADYIQATGWIYLNEFSKHSIKMEFAVKGAIEIILYCYFYMQGFQFRRPEDFYKKNLEIAGEYVAAVKKRFNIANNDIIYQYVADNNAKIYYLILPLADGAAGHYIPTQTFIQWLNIVCPDEVVKKSTKSKSATKTKEKKKK